MSEFLPALFGRLPIVVEGGEQFDLPPSFDFASVGLLSFGAPMSTGAGIEHKPSVADPMVISKRAYEGIIGVYDIEG